MSAGQQHSLADATINQTTSYAYDHLYRLTGDGPTSYSYDPAGNRASMVQGGTTTNYSYDKADRISAAGSTSYTVNSDGNLTARGSDSFSYDQANRLTSATVGGTTSSYAYDGRGKRATKTVSSTTTNYVYDANRRLPVVLDDGTRKYVYGHGLAYATDESGNIQAVYHGDGLRSVRALTDSGANQTGLYRRDAWGVQTTTQGTSTQPFGYTGQLRDTETGLLNLRARMYDPAGGRLLQRDTYRGRLGFPASLNRFDYALNNPATARDPGGHCPFCVAAGVGALIGGGAGAASYLVSLEVEPSKSFSWTDLGKNVAVGAGVGAATGFIGSVAITSAAAALTVNVAAGTVLGAGGEALTETWMGDPLNGSKIVGAGIGGAAGGAIAGELATPAIRSAIEASGVDASGVWGGIAGGLAGAESSFVGTLVGGGAGSTESTASGSAAAAEGGGAGGTDASTTDPSTSQDPGTTVDTSSSDGSTAAVDTSSDTGSVTDAASTDSGSSGDTSTTSGDSGT